MKHLNLAIHQIRIPDVRVTAAYDEELQDQLRGSLETVGQLQPIVVTETPEGYELVDGLHRLQEAQRRGDQKIACVVYQGSQADTMLLNLATNRLRGKTKASEMVHVIGWLVHNQEMDSDEIAKRTGFTRDYVERLWKVSEAHPAVREALDAEQIGVGVAYEVSRLPTPQQQEAVMSTVGAFKMTVGQAKELVDQTLELMQAPAEPEVERPVPVVVVPKCEVCKDSPEHSKLVQIVLCPTCYGDTYALYKRRTEGQDSTVAAGVDGPSP